MRIAYMILDAGVGGHVRSAITIGKSLASKGIKITFVVSKLQVPIDMNGGKYEVIKLGKYHKNFIFDLILLWKLFLILKRRSEKIDLIHAFDLHSYILGYFLSVLLRVPCVSTVCGGTIKYHYPYTKPVIVFSEELKEIMTRKLGFAESEVIVEPARVEKIASKVFLNEGEFCTRINIEKHLKRIIMVSRISPMKFNSIFFIIDVIEKLAKKRRDFIFLLIGQVQNRDVYDSLTKKIEDVNARHGRPVIILNHDLSSIGAECLKFADVVAGVGRVCWEGMSLMKPVIVIGEMGFAGLISPDLDRKQLKEIMYYNFSGRNIKSNDYNKSVEETSNIIEHILDDANFGKRCGKFGYKLFTRFYNVEKGVKTYYAVYTQLLNAQKKQKRDNILYPLFGYIILFGGWLRMKIRNINKYYSRKLRWNLFIGFIF